LQSYIKNVYFGARDGKTDVIYSSDEEKVKGVVSVAKETLLEDIASCMKIDPDFDVYRTCFRDLSIYFHNNLEKKFGPQWIVTTGKVANCFMITTSNPEHEEYFFRIEDIYFEVFKYNESLTTQQLLETFEELEAIKKMEKAQKSGEQYKLNESEKADQNTDQNADQNTDQKTDPKTDQKTDTKVQKEKVTKTKNVENKPKPENVLNKKIEL